MTTLESISRTATAASKATPVAAGTAITLSCRNVWKLFGNGADAFLASHPDASDEALTGAGLVRAVRDVSIDVHHAEIFVIMGLSGSGKSTLVRCMSRL